MGRGLLLAMALAALTRLVSLAMPLLSFPPVYRCAVEGAPLFVAVYLAARAAGRHAEAERATALFHGDRLALQGLVGLSGLPLGHLEYRLLGLIPPAGDLRESSMWLLALILLVFSGLLEELICHGLVQYNAVRAPGVGGIDYAAALGAVISMGYHYS
jgi:hypothetical protein